MEDKEGEENKENAEEEKENTGTLIDDLVK